ncbi:MAG: amino acid ABC transporter substrate-binding protein [Firmicutes bacterium]|nr:amino acid ABC transporter substrate-binding protein [Bacillota bacterium]
MSTRNRKDCTITRILLAGVILLTMCLGFSSSAVTAQKPIKIGAMLHLSAVEPVLALMEKRGFEVAINEVGPIQGRPVELIVADVTSIEEMQSEARRLIKEGCNVLIGSSVDSWDKAIVPIAERNKVVLYLTLTGGPELTELGSPWVFRTCPVSPDEGAFQAEWFIDSMMGPLGLEVADVKAGLVYRDDSWGATMGENCSRVLREAGIPIVVEEYYSGEEVRDMTPVILKLKSAGVNAVFSGHFREGAILFYEAAEKYDFNPAVFIGTGAFEGTLQTVETLGVNGAEGLLASNYPPENAPEDFARDVPKLIKVYRETYKEEIETPHYLSAYNGIMFLLDALQRTEDLDSAESIRDAIAATDIPEGEIGIGWGCKFSTAEEPWKGMVGQNMRSFFVGTQVFDGELWQVYPFAVPGKELAIPIPNWSEKR